MSDLITPLSGEVVLEVNQKVVSEPETVNADPYGDGLARQRHPARVTRRRPTCFSDVDAYKQVVADS